MSVDWQSKVLSPLMAAFGQPITYYSVKDKYNDWKNATNNREIAFEPLRSLSTRLFNTLLSCGVTEQTANDYKTINRKMQGRHSKLTKADSGKVINLEKANSDSGEIKKTVVVPGKLALTNLKRSGFVFIKMI